MKTITLTLCVLVALGSAVSAHSQALGTDMWTGELMKDAMFQPHVDDCDSTTEVFVPMGANSSRGFCIEKDERAADYFEDARETCMALQKRLPEPIEFKFACQGAGGLNNMTDDYEWASNFTHLVIVSGTNTVYSVIAGNGGCVKSSADSVSSSSSVENSNPFRCVR